MSGKIAADKQRAIFSQNLNYYMERAGKTTSDLSSDLNFPFSTVSDWVHGKKYPRMDKVQVLADYFGILKSNLTEENVCPLPGNVAVMEPMEKIPLVGRIACGMPVFAEADIEGYVDLPGHIKADFALTCRGDGMINAGIRNGDVVYVQKRERVENGQIAAVQIDGDEPVLKRFFYDGACIRLASENTSVSTQFFFSQEMERVRIIGLAVGYTHAIEN